ncbi:DUF7289 family protein [Halosolutus halophilus]|uniref:DUF7289 family protein n=1 Tax=Halosolutus halophilus TaxID=1552990 RepID=UPI0022350A0F|nr:hypothetical protein [Halosolutus halophilus]
MESRLGSKYINSITSNRGQAALLGIVLLIGMVAVTSVGIFLVGGEAITNTEQQTENERIEQSFVEMGHTMATASADSDGMRSMQFEAGDSGAVTKSDAGWIRIEGDDVDINRSIGAVEYEGDDGTVVAYQAGGVWSERGNQTRMLSAPNVNYDPEAETLWFPITTLSGEGTLDSGEIAVRQNSTDPMDGVRFVENDSVTMTIQSEYYRGWEQFFREEAGGVSVQEVDHENRTVKVMLGYADFDDAFQEGVMINGGEGDFDDKQGVIGDEYETGTPMPPMDDVIDEMIEDAQSGDVDENLTGDQTATLEDGTYYVDEVNGDVDYNVDLSDGNTTLIVGGDWKHEGEINVTDRAGDNVLRIYVGGDIAEFDGEVCVKGCNGNAEVIQFYGPSTMAVSFGPNNSGHFEGILYVASDEKKDWWDGLTIQDGGTCAPDQNRDKEDYQVHMQAGGGTNFSGSIVAYSVCALSNASTFNYAEALADADVDPYPEGYERPPQITYLNVAVHELDVKNE